MYFHTRSQWYEFKNHNTIKLRTSRNLPQPTGSRYCGLEDMKAVVTPKAVHRLMSGISSITWSRTVRQSCSTRVAIVGVESAVSCRSWLRGVSVELDNDKELRIADNYKTELKYFLTAAEIRFFSLLQIIACLRIPSMRFVLHYGHQYVTSSETILRVGTSFGNPGSFSLISFFTKYLNIYRFAA